MYEIYYDGNICITAAFYVRDDFLRLICVGLIINIIIIIIGDLVPRNYRT